MNTSGGNGTSEFFTIILCPLCYYCLGRVDFVLIVFSFVALCVETGANTNPSLSYLAVVRPLKLLRSVYIIN